MNITSRIVSREQRVTYSNLSGAILPLTESIKCAYSQLIRDFAVLAISLFAHKLEMVTETN